jgi:hypothetical protein
VPGDVAKSANYRYFGVHAGIGLEGRLTRNFTLNGDLLGLVRSRTDDGTVPEYVDPETGRTTDTSGAALLRFGGTYWW